MKKNRKYISMFTVLVMLAVTIFSINTKTVNAAPGWVLPVSSGYTMTNGFSRQSGPSDRPYHLGIDVVTNDRKIFAAANGVVKYSGFTNGNGQHIVIEHNGVYSLYSHLSERWVNVGQTVSAGQQIGVMGSTGNSTGTHLHFAIMNTFSSDPWGYGASSNSSQITYGGIIFYNPLNYINNSGGNPDPNPSFTANARVQGDFLYVRDANGSIIQGRRVDDGDKIRVIKINYDKQLAYVQYPTANGSREGWVTNATNIIKYYYQGEYHNGSTPEPVYDENGTKIGSLDPREAATPLYRQNGRLYVVYATSKGGNTKGGFVDYNGGFNKF